MAKMKPPPNLPYDNLPNDVCATADVVWTLAERAQTAILDPINELVIIARHGAPDDVWVWVPKMAKFCLDAGGFGL